MASSFPSDGTHDLRKIYNFHQVQKDWLFGHISYNYKSQLGYGRVNKIPKIDFGELFFWQPLYVFVINEKNIDLHSLHPISDDFWKKIFKKNDTALCSSTQILSPLKLAITKEKYIENIIALQEKIKQGDFYEINYCIYQSGIIACDPIQIFKQLNTKNEAPFSVFYKYNNQYALCTSPERFLSKQEHLLISQPIKGTRRRGIDTEDDLIQRMTLERDEKERSENVMIVDLVRNDLAHVCEAGTIKVDELMGIHTYKQVHQMISSITGTIKDNNNWCDAINACFPMGSMTGAPKKIVCEQIDEIEGWNRGLFSGSIGYIHPNGNFDFNVMIRTLFYNGDTNTIFIPTGSAITYLSDAEEEWQECLLKAASIKDVINPAY